MSKIKSKLRVLKEFRSRFGAFKTLRHAVFRLVNKFFYFDCLHIITLNRENLKLFDPAKTRKFNVKLATLEDLKEMEKQGCWHIHQKKIGYFNKGDTCLLSYVDNKLAGYTWAHGHGCPELVSGLRLSLPYEYLYNFAGFTHPDYRGYGLQSFRHHELLNHPQWRDRKGLLGFVINTNYSSKRGQEKGGYERIGNIYIIGSKSHFYALIGKNLRCMGIKRIKKSESISTLNEL